MSVEGAAMMLRRLYAATMLGMLCACGSPTSGITFRAPSTFHSQVSIGPFARIWANAHKSALVLVQLPTAVPLHELVQNADVRDGDVRSKRRILICGHQAAIEADVLGTTGNTFSLGADQSPSQRAPGTIDVKTAKGNITVGVGNRTNAATARSDIEIVGTDLGDRAYLAMYVRPVGSKADGAAVAAIHNLCKRP
jgi:hypothetical protein